MNFSVGFNGGKSTLFQRMSPNKGSIVGTNALAATQASSATMPGGPDFAKTASNMPPGTSSTAGGQTRGSNNAASPFREALKRGVVSGAGMLTF